MDDKQKPELTLITTQDKAKMRHALIEASKRFTGRDPTPEELAAGDAALEEFFADDGAPDDSK